MFYIVFFYFIILFTITIEILDPIRPLTKNLDRRSIV